MQCLPFGIAFSTITQVPLAIYTHNLVNRFADWSWATRNLGNTSPTHSGSNSISVTPAAWTAPSFQHSDFSAAAYGSLTFWANGGSGEGRARHLRARRNRCAAERRAEDWPPHLPRCVDLNVNCYTSSRIRWICSHGLQSRRTGWPGMF
jgi:hypothetical protein